MTRRQGIVMAVGLGALVVWLSGCGQGQVLAKVGAEKITVQDFNLALGNLPDSYKTLMSTFEGKRQLLDNLVKKSLLVQEAEQRGYQKQKPVKERIQNYLRRSKEKIQEQMRALKQNLAVLKQQVYETVMLQELNEHLKQEEIPKSNLSEEEIQNYYDDYARKLKLLNPAVKVPPLDKVDPQIRAILVEEKLIQKLEKEHKVYIKEATFRELYGNPKEDVTIQDNTKANR